MADNQRIKDLNDDYKAVLKTVNEIQREEEKLLKVNKELSREKQEQLKDAQKRADMLERQIKSEKISADVAKQQERELRSISSSYIRIDESVKNQLKGGKTYLSISAQIAKEKARELRYENPKTKFQKEQRRNIEVRQSILGDIAQNELDQAKATERAEAALKGTTSFDKDRLNLEANKKFLTKEQYDLAKASIDATELNYKKEQRLLQLKEQQKDLYAAIPASIKSGVDFGKNLVSTLTTAGAVTAGIAILGGIFLSALTSFIALDEAADKFNDETKIAISQMGEMQTQANNLVADFRNIGLEAQDYYDIQKEIIGVLGDSARISDSIAGAQAVLTKNFGVSNKAAAETLQIFQSLGGVSENTAASLQLQTMELARQAGVAPAKVLEDIAESSDAIYGAFRGNSEELVTAAVQARRLGTNLKDVLETTDKLLDFESSITKELEASAFVGGQFNLTQARALRAAGDVAGAQEEILRQIQRSGDFRQQDVFTQRALAEAAGMTVDEIARQLTVQDKLNSLSDEQKKLAEEAIENGLDISNINDNQLQQEVQKFALQKEQQGQVANLSNAFQGIAATLGASLVPLLEAITPLLTLALTPVQLMAEGLSSIVGFIKENIELVTTLASLTAMYYAYKHRSFLIDKAEVAYKKIKLFLTNREIAKEAALAAIKAVSNPVGALAGIAAAALVIGTISAIRAKSVADLMIDPNGGPVVYSPQEGGLFQGTNNDAAILAPPNALVGNQSSNGTDKLLRSIERLEKAYMRGVQVNLDGQNVMRGLGRVGNETTQNNFSLT